MRQFRYLKPQSSLNRRQVKWIRSHMKPLLLSFLIFLTSCAAEKAFEDTGVHLDFEVDKPSDKAPMKPAEEAKAAPAVKELL